MALNFSSIDVALEGVEVDRFLTKDERFEVSANQYSIRLFSRGNDEPPQRVNIPVNADYGLVLEFTGKKGTKDIAALGFSQYKEGIVCVSIRGGKRQYKPLSSVFWDRLLLEKASEFGKNLNINTVACLPSYRTEEYTCALADKLEKRYDRNARDTGFKFDKFSELYIKRIK